MREDIIKAFVKSKNKKVRLPMRSNGWPVNFFIFNSTTMFVQLSSQPSSCLVNVTKITRRTWNKIHASSVLNWNKTFRRGKNDSINRSNRDFETKTPKHLRSFERIKIERIKMQNYRIEVWVRTTNRVFRLFEFIQGFIIDRRFVASREIKRFQVIKFLREQICKAR